MTVPEQDRKPQRDWWRNPWKLIGAAFLAYYLIYASVTNDGEGLPGALLLVLLGFGVYQFIRWSARKGDKIGKRYLQRCPWCKSEIRRDAVVCRFCSRDIPPDNDPAPA